MAEIFAGADALTRAKSDCPSGPSSEIFAVADTGSEAAMAMPVAEFWNVSKIDGGRAVRLQLLLIGLLCPLGVDPGYGDIRFAGRIQVQCRMVSAIQAVEGQRFRESVIRKRVIRSL